jgi:Redoxin
VPICAELRVRTIFRRLSAMMIFLSLAASCFAAPEHYGIDLDGKPVRDLAGPGVRVVVLVFAASDCPISNRYVPEIARLNKEFSSHGVRFWWVFPNPEDRAPVVSQHVKDFAIHEDTLLDRDQALVKRAGATVTPEAAVFTADLREVYHGRIDDRYLDIGQERPQPQRHDLEAAIAAALAGRPIPQPGGPPVGCSIVFLQR